MPMLENKMTSNSPVESDEVAEPGVYVRRHKQTLRRQASFKRMQNLPVRVDDWFFGDETLHREWAEFVLQHKHRSPVFTSQDPAEGQTSLTESDHIAKEIHVLFCDSFEKALSHFLRSNGFTTDEFQDAFRIAKDEEERTGDHFFRWPEVVEYPVFLKLMREGPDGLLAAIRKISEDAMSDFRKRVSIFPLLVAWGPKSFADVDEAVRHVSTKIPLKLTKSLQKEQARWRAKLLEKKLDENGVYSDPPRNEIEWARYVCFVSKELDTSAFDEFCHELTDWFTARNEQNHTTPEQKARQLLLKCFEAIDDHHHGTMDLTRALLAVEKSGCCTAKQLRKLEIKYRLLARQAALDQMYSSSEPAEHEGDDTAVNLTLNQAMEFLRDAVGGDEVQKFPEWAQRLAAIEYCARDL